MLIFREYVSLPVSVATCPLRYAHVDGVFVTLCGCRCLICRNLFHSIRNVYKRISDYSR